MNDIIRKDDKNKQSKRNKTERMERQAQYEDLTD